MPLGRFGGKSSDTLRVRTGGGGQSGASLLDSALERRHPTPEGTQLDTEQIADLAVTGAKIANLTITAANIANLTITAAQIENATITGDKIASLTITATNIANATITTTQIASATITGSNIASATITGSNIASATITATNIQSATITGSLIASGTITSSNIQNATITGTDIASATITGSNIASATVTGSNIASATITGSNIASATITATNIQSATITASLIANLTITAAQISNLTITSGKLTLTDAAYAENLVINGSFEFFSSGTTAAPDAWTLTGTSATIARTTSSGDIKALCQSAVAITNGASNAADLGQSLTVSATVNTHLRGMAVTFTCYVKCSTASRASLKIDDGVGTTSSSNHTGGGTFELLSVTRTLDASATKCEVSIEISSGSAITVTADGAMLALGSAPVAFARHSDDTQTVVVVKDDPGIDVITATTSGSPDVISNLTASNVIVNGKQSVRFTLTYEVSHQTANNRVNIQFKRDSTRVPDNSYAYICPVADGGSGVNAFSGSLIYVDRKPAAGNYTYSVEAFTSAGNGQIAKKLFIVEVIPDQ